MAISHNTVVALILLLFMVCNTENAPNAADPATNKNAEPVTLEKVLLGPLRLWHIIFIVGTILIIALVILCCFLECRVPRTRQEMEENYKQRCLNEKYLSQLQKAPAVIMERKEIS